MNNTQIIMNFIDEKLDKNNQILIVGGSHSSKTFQQIKDAYKKGYTQALSEIKDFIQNDIRGE